MREAVAAEPRAGEIGEVGCWLLGPGADFDRPNLTAPGAPPPPPPPSVAYAASVVGCFMPQLPQNGEVTLLPQLGQNEPVPALGTVGTVDTAAEADADAVADAEVPLLGRVRLAPPAPAPAPALLLVLLVGALAVY